ncbi:hypothetical protein LZC95_22750 [Pendulispora brunnea]|uniref:Uncharacterized protein n=1 Tax=Pendulispora brunnea TaxID=2905690 RepID=A0ABZ2KPL6_9BACT
MRIRSRIPLFRRRPRYGRPFFRGPRFYLFDDPLYAWPPIEDLDDLDEIEQELDELDAIDDFDGLPRRNMLRR